MRRSVVLLVAVASLVGTASFVWMGVRQEREFRRLMAVGDAAVSREERSEAIEAFSGALALKRDSMVAHLKRGETYRRRGDLDAALRDLREAARLDSTAPQPLERLGDVYRALGRDEEAAAEYRRFLALDDRAPGVLYKLALARYRQGTPAESLDPLRRAIGLDERLTEAHYLLGASLRALGRPEDAILALRRAVTVTPAFAPAREELAALYDELGRGREAIEQLEALAALEPDRPERLVAVARAYARRGRLDAAMLTLGRAADRHPDSALVRAEIGRVWLGVWDAEEDPQALRTALASLERFAARADAGSDALTLYGRAQFLAGDAAAAERTLRQAIARAPVDPLAYRYLAVAARRLDHAEAAADAERHYAALAGGRP
jgi:tetratricopeptide (TPR) repeat protein